MVKNSTLLLLVMFLFGCNIKFEQKDSKKNQEKKTEIFFPKKVIDFGILPNDTNVEAIFHIKNLGSNKLIIKDVNPECGCTGHILQNKRVMPGDSTSLTVKLSTKNQMKGLHRKAIFIESNTEKEFNTLFMRFIVE